MRVPERGKSLKVSERETDLKTRKSLNRERFREKEENIK